MYEPPLLLHDPDTPPCDSRGCRSEIATIPTAVDIRTWDAAGSAGGTVPSTVGRSAAVPLAVAGRCRQARLMPSTWQLRRSETSGRTRSHTSDVFRSKGYGFKASRRISLSSTRSPIFV